MQEFLKQLAKRLTDAGFIVTPPKWGSFTADGVNLTVESIADDANYNERVLFCHSTFAIRANGTIPGINKAVGLAVDFIGRVKARRARIANRTGRTARGKDAVITEQPGGFTLTVKFADHATATIALDCLMEHGLVMPATEETKEGQ